MTGEAAPESLQRVRCMESLVPLLQDLDVVIVDPAPGEEVTLLFRPGIMTPATIGRVIAGLREAGFSVKVLEESGRGV